MGYQKISNLYRDQDILMFKEVFCLSKIHGTSSHISFDGKDLRFFSGGANYEEFKKLFDEPTLLEKFKATYNNIPITVYGEAYGGKMQGMSKTYGPKLKFVAFDIKIGDRWLSVPQAESLVKSLDLEFVFYVRSSTDLAELDKWRDLPSQQAIRNGMGDGHIEEGIVIRPLIELTKNDGSRIIAKHKRDEFRETASRKIVSTDTQQVLEDAKLIAYDYTTTMRLNHILSKIPEPHTVEMTGDIIKAMIEDIKVESEGEVVWSKEVGKAIGGIAVQLYHNYLKGASPFGTP